ncbi:SAM-dependent methyltransferase [Streptomyces marincola]|uniref:SAM-dependent methyltransferase n=1 Tax=Streptomyces marincola TaxID=2878388 RepID=UPI001CF3B478|nr:SAM-dependent methyltransferase [Streptomyces marincola]UCM90120.1 SAM-dependent methyltransferase [Streptomyces marincola]
MNTPPHAPSSIAANPAADAEIDVSVRNDARVWDHWLGGRHTFAVDRAAGNRLAMEFPGLLEKVRTTRHFLGRAVGHLAGEAGIDQFLDVGAGLPTSGSTHEVAGRAVPTARVVYVDNNPQVVRYARRILAGTRRDAVAYAEADLHRTEDVLAAAARTLDLSRPVALVLSGILGHAPTHEQACATVERLMAALPSGSYLLAHDMSDTLPDWCALQARHNSSNPFPYHLRSAERIAAYFAGLDLVPPGVVPVVSWRPDELDPYGPDWTALVTDIVGGVGRKP